MIFLFKVSFFLHTYRVYGKDKGVLLLNFVVSLDLKFRILRMKK
jgi:hypothetical protein